MSSLSQTLKQKKKPGEINFVEQEKETNIINNPKIPYSVTF